jgi:hypothetical protein
VGDPRKQTAVLVVDDTDIKRLAPGQKTRLRIDELPGQVVDGEVLEVARHKLSDIENLKTRQADLSPLLAGLVAPENTGALYEVRVRFGQESKDKRQEPEEERGARTKAQEGFTTQSSLLAPRSSPLTIGGRGDAKVTAERITIGRRIYRYLAQTFRLPM